MAGEEELVNEGAFPLRVSAMLLAAVVFSLGFMQPNIRISRMAIQFTDALFVVLLMATAVAVLSRALRLRVDRFYLILAAYFAALTLSAIFSAESDRSFFKLAGEAYLIGLAVIAGQLVRSETMFRKIFLTWIAASTIVCLIGIVTVAVFYVDRTNIWLDWFLHHYGSLPPGNYPRIQSTYIYPGMFCNYLTVSVMMLFVAGRSGWMGRSAVFAATGLHLIAAAFTITPGLGGLLFAVSAWFALAAKAEGRKSASALWLSAGVAAAAAFLVVSLFTLRPIETAPYSLNVLGTEVFPTQRLLTWQGAAATALEYPVFGKGLGLGVARVEFLAPSGQRQMLTDAHNTWLNVAGSTGLAGLTAILLITIVPVRRLWPLKFGGDPMSVIRAGLGIAFVSSFIIQGMVGSFENARHLWLLIGLMLAATDRSD